MSIYRGYDQEALDLQYTPRQTVPNVETYIEGWRAASARARETLACERDLAYGPGPAETLDFFPAEREGAPVAVFLHGGTWRFMTKEASAYAAATFVGAGAAFAVLDFANVPAVDLDGMVGQVRAALVWLHGNVARHGGDPERLHVIGHSSGAHLGAMLLAPGWAGALGAPADLVKSVLCVSGLYDLAPVCLTYRQDYLRLDESGIARNSPILNLPEAGPPITVAWAEGDTDEFGRQAEAYAAACRAGGLAVETLVMEGCNHFDQLDALRDPAGPLARAVLERMGLADG